MEKYSKWTLLRQITREFTTKFKTMKRHLTLRFNPVWIHQPPGAARAARAPGATGNGAARTPAATATGGWAWHGRSQSTLANLGGKEHRKVKETMTITCVGGPWQTYLKSLNPSEQLLAAV